MVVQAGGGEGVGRQHAALGQELAHFRQELSREQMFGNVVAAVGVQQHGVVAFAPHEGPLYEHSGVRHRHLEPLAGGEIEVALRQRHHRRIDLHRVDGGCWQQRRQRGGQRATAEAGHQDALRRGIQQQHRHHHAGVGEHHPLRRLRVHAGLVPLLPPQREAQAEAVLFLHHEDVLVQRLLAVQHRARGEGRQRYRGGSQRQQSSRRRHAWATAGRRGATIAPRPNSASSEAKPATTVPISNQSTK